MEEKASIQRRIKQHKLQRKARRGEIAVRRCYKLIRFLIILFIFYSVYRLALTQFWYLPTELYESNAVEIMGNSIVSKEKIIGRMQNISLPNEPLYKINPKELANEIEKLTPIKRAYIRRFWFPARLTVMIEEYTPAITIAPKEEVPDVAALTFSGELINREYLPLSSKYKTTRILSYGTKGDDYENWDKEKINNLYKLSKLLEEYSGEKVIYIDMRNPHDLYAQLESAKLRLGEFDTEIFERIKAIHTILPELKLIEQKIKYVDLSWKKSKYLKLEE